jgi:hypothetical protein
MPELQDIEEIKCDEAEDRNATEKLNRGEQTLAIVAVDDDPTHGAEQKPRRRLAETENPQGPRLRRKRNFLPRFLQRFRAALPSVGFAV